jgi:hypothetical protein
MSGFFRKLRLESLENRRMMAVDVDQDGDTLIITGDDGGVSADVVEIRGLDEERFRVTADFGNGVATRRFEGIEEFIIRLGADADILTIRDIEDDDDVDRFDIRMGAGEDQVTIRNVVAGELDLRTDGGVDAVTIRNSRFEDDVDIRLGGAADTLDIRGSRFEGDQLSLNGGAGADTVSGGRNTVDEDTDVDIVNFETDTFGFREAEDEEED